MMEFLPMKILVISYVTLVMNYLVMIAGPVRVMEIGVIPMPHVEEVVSC